MYRLVMCLLFICTFCVSMLANDLKPVKYVFLFIGDGLSVPQRMMGEEFAKKVNGEGLIINSMQHESPTTTGSANALITDSAASGTAIACGAKTNNLFLGVDPDGNKLESIAEVAYKNGRKVGIISSVTINHATPGAFYAHNSSRSNYYQIGLDLIASGFNYFGGGGIAQNNHEKDPQYKGDIYKLAEEAGYTVSRNAEGFKNIKPGMDKIISICSGGNMPYVLDTKKNALTLADFTNQAIEVLDNPKGFFIMVEGGKIDWVCHANDAATTLYEIIDFDNAVKVAYNFAKEHPEDTLIVVTGDHETGGLTLGFAGTGITSNIEYLKAQTASTDVISGKFKALKNPSFDDVKKLINELSGLIFAIDGKRAEGGLNLTELEEKKFEELFKKQYKDGKFTGGNLLTQETIRTLNHKCGLAWSTGGHTALPVNTSTYGVNSKIFPKEIDNTDIAKTLKQIVR